MGYEYSGPLILLRWLGGAILVGLCLALGIVLTQWIPVPGAIIGMVLLLAVLPLAQRWFKTLAKGVIELADVVLSNMVLVLLPVSVGALHLIMQSESRGSLMLLLVLSLVPSLLCMVLYMRRKKF